MQSEIIMLKYSQLCDRHRNGSGTYFYVRGWDRSPRLFSGNWELPDSYVFTVFYANVERWLDDLDFYICQTGGDKNSEIVISSIAEGYYDDSFNYVYKRRMITGIAGKFRIICHGSGKTYGKRLIEWWELGDGSVNYAELCAKYLKPRVTKIPQEEVERAIAKPRAFDVVLGGFSQLHFAAVLSSKHKSP